MPADSSAGLRHRNTRNGVRAGGDTGDRRARWCCIGGHGPVRVAMMSRAALRRRRCRPSVNARKLRLPDSRIEHSAPEDQSREGISAALLWSSGALCSSLSVSFPALTFGARPWRVAHGSWPRSVPFCSRRTRLDGIHHRVIREEEMPRFSRCPPSASAAWVAAFVSLANPRTAAVSRDRAAANRRPGNQISHQE